jgi:hypothetical protein
VGLDGAAENLRPGMSAKVEILIDERRNALAIPVQSVVQRGDEGICYVLGARPELRHLRLGKSSHEYVEVLEGLSAGERVVMSPDFLGIPPHAFDEESETSAATSAQSDASGAEHEEPEPLVQEVVQELAYEAELSGVPVTSAKAEFKIKTKDSVPAYKFRTKVAGGPPGATYEIKVDKVAIGSVTLDDTGTCALELSTKLGNFPPHFPQEVGPGSLVELGEDLHGTLAQVAN